MDHFPNVSTVEAALAFNDRYTGRYRGHWFTITLSAHGFYLTTIDNRNRHVCVTIREALDNIYKELEK